MIEVDNQNIVIDTGPDFRQQMLRENVSNLVFILFYMIRIVRKPRLKRPCPRLPQRVYL